MIIYQICDNVNNFYFCSQSFYINFNLTFIQNPPMKIEVENSQGKIYNKVFPEYKNEQNLSFVFNDIFDKKKVFSKVLFNYLCYVFTMQKTYINNYLIGIKKKH